MMKQLYGGFAGAAWDDDMVRNIRFIKDRLRYPIGRATWAPVALAALMLPAVCTVAGTAVFGRHTGNNSLLHALFFLCFIMIGAVITMKRCRDVLKFKAIATPYYLADNQLLILRFLESQHLAFARHPKAPEVFQIMSREIRSLNDEREIIIFIADDHRILINSHFTRTGTSFALGRPHHLQMAAMLHSWIIAGQANRQGLTQSSF